MHITIRGYVDDPRNTDNAWMETVAFNFHDPSGQEVCFNEDQSTPSSFLNLERDFIFAQVGQLPLQAGDDAGAIQWMPLNKEVLYMSEE